MFGMQMTLTAGFSHRTLTQTLKVNGYRGERLIERLGLGVDGYAVERLAQQQQRDAGKLGGVSLELMLTA